MEAQKIVDPDVNGATAITLKWETVRHKEYLSTQEVSMLYGIKKPNLYKLMCTKKINYMKPNGKIAYFKKTDVEAYLNSNPMATTQNKQLFNFNSKF